MVYVPLVFTLVNVYSFTSGPSSVTAIARPLAGATPEEPTGHCMFLPVMLPSSIEHTWCQPQ